MAEENQRPNSPSSPDVSPSLPHTANGDVELFNSLDMQDIGHSSSSKDPQDEVATRQPRRIRSMNRGEGKLTQNFIADKQGFREAMGALEKVHNAEVDSVLKEVARLRAENDTLRKNIQSLIENGHALSPSAGSNQQLNVPTSPGHADAVPPRTKPPSLFPPAAPNGRSSFRAVESLLAARDDGHPARHSSRHGTAEKQSPPISIAHVAEQDQSRDAIQETVANSGKKGSDMTESTMAKSSTGSSSPKRGTQRCSITRSNGRLVFSLHQPWDQKEDKMAAKVGASSFSRISSTVSAANITKWTAEEMQNVGTSPLQPFVIHPSSGKRFTWDIISTVFLAYDIITIPFLGAFDPSPHILIDCMMWITMLFWTCDVFFSFLTGYQEEHQLVLRPSLIAKRYLRTWFIMDILLVVMDWSINVFTKADSVLNFWRGLRTLRFVRTLRLVRLVKMKRILQDIQDQINTEFSSICFGILKIVLCLVIANHIVACSWYAIGTMHSDDLPEGLTTWLIFHEVDDKEIGYQYTTSMHWSLTQFTPASMEVVPHNTSERTFSVLVLLMAMIAFSSFVSILTAMIAELRRISSDESRQFWLLRRYLRDWGVEKAVSTKVRRYLEYAYAKQRQRVQAKDVALLTLLSDPLRDELKHATISVNLVNHPLFMHCNERTRVFSKSLIEMGLARGDFLFPCGEEAKSMYFLAWGLVSYQLGHWEQPLPDQQPMMEGVEEGDDHVSPHKQGSIESAMTGLTDEEESECVYEGQWLSEPVLWVSNWLHLGDCQAITECQLVAIPRVGFSEAISANKPLWICLKEYAKMFVEYLNCLQEYELTDLMHQVLSSSELIEAVDFAKHGVEEKETANSMTDNAMSRQITRLKRNVNTMMGGAFNRVETKNFVVRRVDSSAPKMSGGMKKSSSLVMGD